MGKFFIKEIKSCIQCGFYLKGNYIVQTGFNYGCSHPLSEGMNFGFGFANFSVWNAQYQTIEQKEYPLLRHATQKSIGSIKIPNRCPMPDYDEDLRRQTYGLPRTP